MFSTKVLKSWKGAKSGETLWIRYEGLGHPIPYKVGKIYIFYADKKSGAFVMGPCFAVGLQFKMSKKLKKFIESSPYIEQEPDDYLRSKFYGTPLIHHYEKCKSQPNNKACYLLHPQKPKLINIKGYNKKDLWALLYSKVSPRYAKNPLGKSSKSNIEKLKVLVNNNNEDVLTELMRKTL